MTSAATTSARPAIPTFRAGDSGEAIAAAFAEHGCVVVTDAISDETRARIRSELAPIMASAPVQQDDPTAFYPGLTRRAVALVVRSQTTRDLVLHPTSLALASRHLDANCERFQLHATAAVEVGPGARPQVLHREEDPFKIFPLPRPNLVIASIWAISDFTEANGATRVVPGSQRWTSGRVAREDEVAIGAMPAGSVLYWAGGLLHGAGENRSQAWRYGIILTYSCGWLRQEENQYLEVARDEIPRLDPELRKVAGFTMHGALGYRDPRL
jgi:ectoine hydroxylase-related dioxygenase (phytanoyl-CoA dioxygenase family)